MFEKHPEVMCLLLGAIAGAVILTVLNPNEPGPAWRLYYVGKGSEQEVMGVNWRYGLQDALNIAYESADYCEDMIRVAYSDGRSECYAVPVERRWDYALP